MKLSGDRLFSVDRETLWRAVTDPDVLAGTLPGCEALEEVGDNAYRGALDLRVGPVRGTFRGSLELSELEPPRAYRMKLAGQGPAGFLRGEGSVRLEEEEGGTRLAYELDAQVGGRVAGLGQRVLDGAAGVVASEGLAELARQIETAPTSRTEGDGAPAQAIEPSTATRMATRVAGGLWRELVPAGLRRWLAVVGWVGLGGALGWALRSWLG